MYVSVAVDPGSEERAKELASLLGEYGFEKVQRGLWESTVVSPSTLTRIKRDMDRLTDAFDRVRFFQYPLEGTLVLSSLRDKKWRRLVARGGEEGAVVKRPAVKEASGNPRKSTLVKTIRKK
ncbi:MAG: CRISPR-associated protein Cas2 [Spirochaetaceae bacterium]|jgi:CRISPR-associated protein Cas2|nr:CRISPR-associated protein Cas2 [Spirochaetaceae bacterium]